MSREKWSEKASRGPMRQEPEPRIHACPRRYGPETVMPDESADIVRICLRRGTWTRNLPRRSD